ncbi:hypothetical protein HAX54_046322, partial [Datura stramonium]|nr:hypothetical protein [Datura stramonium]
RNGSSPCGFDNSVLKKSHYITCTTHTLADTLDVKKSRQIIGTRCGRRHTCPSILGEKPHSFWSLLTAQRTNRPSVHESSFCPSKPDNTSLKYPYFLLRTLVDEWLDALENRLRNL